MKTRISVYQAALLLTIAATATTLVFLPRLIVAQSDTDALLATLLLVGFSLSLTGVYIPLANRMGQQDLITFNRRVMGNFLTVPVAVVLYVYFILINGVIVRETGEVMVTVYLPRTPLWFFNLTAVVVAAAFVYYGLEVIGRSGEILFYLFAFFYLFLMLLILKETSPEHLLPFLSRGIKPVIKGAYPGLVFFSEFFFFLILAPNIYERKKSGRALYGAVLLMGLFMLVSVAVPLMLFGSNFMKTIMFPVLMATRYIEAFNVVTRMDPILFMFLWAGGGIVKIALFLYGGVYILQKLFGLKTPFVLIPLTALLVFLISQYFFDSVTEVMNFLMNITPHFTAVQVGYPIILLMLSLVRGIRNES